MPATSNLAAEALCATTGILQTEPVSPEQGRLARRIPDEWRGEAMAFLDADKARAFKMPRQPDHMKVLEQLSTGLTAERRATLVSRLADPDLAEAYLEQVARATAWLRARWTVLSLDTPIGPRLEPPGKVEQMRAASLLSVVDGPERILTEMRSRTLTSEQAEALDACYPALFGMLKSMLWEGLTKRYKTPEKYSLSWAHELVIRRLVGLAPEVSLSTVEPPPEKAPPKVGPIQFDASKLETKAQTLAQR